MAHVKAGKRSYAGISHTEQVLPAVERTPGGSSEPVPGPSPAPLRAGPSASHPLLIVGLDQGTAYTGYAMCPFVPASAVDGGVLFETLKHANNSTETGNLCRDAASGDNRDRFKSPSVVAEETLVHWADRQRSDPSTDRWYMFGAEAQRYAQTFAETRLADSTALPVYDVYSDFKRPLHPQARQQTDVLSVYCNSVTYSTHRMRCVDAVALVSLECLYRALKQYNSESLAGVSWDQDDSAAATLSNTRVQVVATYPNEWDASVVHAVRAAIVAAPAKYLKKQVQEYKLGLLMPDDLIQVPESVAASISLAVQAAAAHEKRSRSKVDTTGGSELLHEGMVILSCDAGAGTVDITVNEVQSLKPFRVKEVVYSRGRNLGGSMVEDAFMRFLTEQLKHLGVREEDWTANPMVEHTLRAQLTEMKDRYSTEKVHYACDGELNVHVLEALFPSSLKSTSSNSESDWWANVRRHFQELGAAQKCGTVIDISMMPEQPEPIRYVYKGLTDAFSVHSQQRYLIVIPPRFMHELLAYNANCIVDFVLDVVHKINDTPLAPVSAVASSAASSSSSSSAAPGGKFKVDAIFVTGQGTSNPVHRDLLKKRLEMAALAPGQPRRLLQFPRGYAMHVARGAVMYRMLGAAQVQRRLASSYGVRLRLDGKTPWLQAGLSELHAREAGVLYHGNPLDKSLWSLDYIAPFVQVGADVLPDVPYFVEGPGDLDDLLDLKPCADGSPEAYTYEVYALHERLNALGSGKQLHVISRTNQTGVRVVPANSALACVEFMIKSKTTGRLRFNFASGPDGVIACAIVDKEGESVTAMRVVSSPYAGSKPTAEPEPEDVAVESKPRKRPRIKPGPGAQGASLAAPAAASLFGAPAPPTARPPVSRSSSSRSSARAPAAMEEVDDVGDEPQVTVSVAAAANPTQTAGSTGSSRGARRPAATSAAARIRADARR